MFNGFSFNLILFAQLLENHFAILNFIAWRNPDYNGVISTSFIVSVSNFAFLPKSALTVN